MHPPHAVTPISSILVAYKSRFSSIEDGLNSDLNSVLHPADKMDRSPCISKDFNDDFLAIAYSAAK